MKISEEDRDNLCDILWWLKGYKKGANDNLENCPFEEEHIKTLDHVVREMRDILNKKNKTCVITNGEHSWEIKINGHTFNFVGYSFAEYLKTHYESIGYTVTFIETPPEA